MVSVLLNGEMYEVEPAVKVIIDKLMIENAALKRENERLEKNNKDLQEEFYKQGAKIDELKKENARLEEVYQKSVGVISATDCEECKNKVYRKAYNDVMMIRANIQEIIEDVSKKDGGTDNENY